MKKNYSEFKIGATLLLALVILISVIIWGKGYTLTLKSKEVLVRFSDIAGLEQGAYVLVNGVRKGRVAEFILEQGAVLCRLTLDERVLLYDDARFEITSVELMGAKVINVFPGVSGVAHPARFTFAGEAGGGMTELMKRSTLLVQDVQHLLSVLEITIENINKTAGDPRLHDAFLSGIRNLDKSTQRTLDLIKLNEGKLNQVMDNLVATTGDVRNLVAANSEDIDHTLSDIHDFVAELKDVSGGLKNIVQLAQSDSGTFGRLLKDDQLYVTLASTLAGVDSLVQQIRDEGINTHVSLFGGGKKKKDIKDKDK